MIGNRAPIFIDIKHQNLFSIAFKMLVHSRRRFFGMVVGAIVAAFIIMQQPGIYQGIKDRVVAPIREVPGVDLWVMADTSFSFEEPNYFSPIEAYRIRSIPGVLWVKNIYRTWVTLNHPGTAKMTNWELIGVDPDTLHGLPETVISGDRASIQNINSIIVDGYALKQMETADNKTIQLGDIMFEGSNAWIIKGFTKPSFSYALKPKAYMTSNHIPNLSSRPFFMLVKVKPSFNINQIADEIRKETGFLAITPTQFEERAAEYFNKKTPIVMVFIAIAVVGFFIGLVMMWQIFSNFVLSHLHQFGMLKMLGVSSYSLIKMVLFQAGVTGGLGFVLGLLLTALFGIIFNETAVPFHLTWDITLLGAIGSTIVIVFSSYFAILKVLRLDTVELCRDST